jgi:adenylate cyclase
MKKIKTAIWMILIPLIISVVFSLLNLFTFYRIIDYKIFDVFIHIKPPVSQDPSLLLLNMDDTAIENIGTFPWPRDIMADGLILLKEFDAGRVVFDIEYTEPSPKLADETLVESVIPESLSSQYDTLMENVVNLFSALKNGYISMNDMEDYIQQLGAMTEESKQDLLEKIGQIARNIDVYFGQSARFMGKAFFTVNMLKYQEKISEEYEEYVYSHFAIQNIEGEMDGLYTAKFIRPAIEPILKESAGAGFPLIRVDEDGVLRKIDLLIENRGKYFPQLTLSPLLDWLGNPKVILAQDFFFGKRIILKECTMPDGEQKDITIPLTEESRIFVNWLKTRFEDYENHFNQLTYYELVYNKRLEKKLMDQLQAMNSLQFFNFYPSEYDILSLYSYAEGLKTDILNGKDTSEIETYKMVREEFFKEVGNFLDKSTEEAILNNENYINMQSLVQDAFAGTREVFQYIMESRNKLEQYVPGAFIVIGWTGTGTTDIGVTPFEEEYMNVGVHASLANTILSGQFLDDMPLWYSILLAMGLSLLLAMIIRNQKPNMAIIIGIIFLFALTVGTLLLFLFTGIYLSLLTPFLALFFTFISISLIQFLQTEKEKVFIRNAFSHYLSTDVINELLKDPSKLNLGGEEKYITAIFTDIKGFSSVAEILDPTDLVKLLNAYLTEMSNIIMSQRGTIDKYEGDAIISFFGAPVEFEDHARRACLTAIGMKKMERLLNEHFLATKMSPTPLFTRIGINTGKMVVGNMGTDQKMDYTIMGNSVNLAARLEGVNKQYGTWLLISEQTHNDGGKDFLVRKLDRVRVVGIKQPVRLYELIDEKDKTEDRIKEGIELFHKALELFESREWDKAGKGFKEVLNLLPNDGPSQVYIQRCTSYKRKPPAATWDGVFNLTMK